METITRPQNMGSIEFMYAVGAYERYEDLGGHMTWEEWLERCWYA